MYDPNNAVVELKPHELTERAVATVREHTGTIVRKASEKVKEIELPAVAQQLPSSLTAAAREQYRRGVEKLKDVELPGQLAEAASNGARNTAGSAAKNTAEMAKRLKDIDFVQGAFAKSNESKETFQRLMNKYYDNAGSDGGVSATATNLLKTAMNTDYKQKMRELVSGDPVTSMQIATLPDVIATEDISSTALRKMIESQEFHDFMKEEDGTTTADARSWMRNENLTMNAPLLMTTTVLGAAGVLLFLQRRKLIDSVLLEKVLKKTENTAEVIVEKTTVALKTTTDAVGRLTESITDAVFCEHCKANLHSKFTEGLQKVRDGKDLAIELLEKGKNKSIEKSRNLAKNVTGVSLFVIEKTGALWDEAELLRNMTAFGGVLNARASMLCGGIYSSAAFAISQSNEFIDSSLFYIHRFQTLVVVYISKTIKLIWDKTSGVVVLVRDRFSGGIDVAGRWSALQLFGEGSSSGCDGVLSDMMTKSWFFIGKRESKEGSEILKNSKMGSKSSTGGSPNVETSAPPARPWSFFGGYVNDAHGAVSSEESSAMSSSGSSHSGKSRSGWFSGFWKVRETRDEQIEFKNGDESSKESNKEWEVVG